MLVSSLSEMISLGILLPFLGVLSDPSRLLTDARWQPLFVYANITSSSQLVTGLALLFIIATLVASGLRLLTQHVQLTLSASIGSDISSQIFQKTLHQPYCFYIQHNSSDLMQTLIDDTHRITVQVVRPLLVLFTDSMLSIGIIGALILIDARTAVSAAVLLGGAYITIYRLKRKVLEQNSKTISRSGQLKIKAVQESLGGIRELLISHRQSFFQQLYRNSDYNFRQGQAMNAFWAISPRSMVEAIAMCGIALLALASGNDGDFSEVVPVLGALALGAKRLLPALQSVFGCFATIQGSRASLIRVLIALKRSIAPLAILPASEFPLILNKDLQLRDIWFRYSHDSAWVLRGLNMKIAAKTTVGFVGSTGSGKSTTADLILGLLQSQKGEMWVDDQLLKGESLQAWQQGIAMVPQSIFLTDASVAENIAFAVPREEIDFEQVRKAARLARIDEFIEKLPTGYDTYVGERGVRLSGGQRQRIGIARALYRQASVVVFDEATSALDNSTEKEVMTAINGLSHQLTIILIAHRLSTVEKCDKIFELEQGQVVAEGTYQELKESSQSFRHMLSQR
ncbi:MAG: ABC transporter ATP-binding protein [Leptolyngbyaceae cyanobacterium]